MISALTNHLWQSTLFAVAVALLTLAFRKNRAHVRYGLWLSASFKFLLPFALLISLGSRLEWAPSAKTMATPALTVAMQQISEPFPDILPLTPSTQANRDWVPTALLGVWACGFGAIALIRFRGWMRIRAAVRASNPIDTPATVEVRSSPGLLEPGVVGLLRPVLLLPAGITERLTPPQLEAVLAHELCHVRRRDNLTAAIHMVVEAIFWFHPLVWWIGTRLVEEREKACDEEVVSLGSDPRDYAEAILNICKFYAASPLACVSGVSGSNLRKRIEAIMINRSLLRLNFVRKAALVVAGMAAVAAPVVIGMMNAPRVQAQAAPAAIPKFAVASIKPCKDEDSDGGGRGGTKRPNSPGRLDLRCSTVLHLIHSAYVQHASGRFNPWASDVPIEGDPAWIHTELYEIRAKAEGTEDRNMMLGPMLQALLEERFKLKVHRKIKRMPVYELTLAKGGHKLKVAQEGKCILHDVDHPLPPLVPGQPLPTICGGFRGEFIYGTTMAQLCLLLSREFDRPVIEKTGLAGVFDIQLDYSSYGEAGQNVLPAGSPLPEPGSPEEAAYKAAWSTTLQNVLRKLGLNVKSAKGPGEFLVVDHVARPTEN